MFGIFSDFYPCVIHSRVKQKPPRYICDWSSTVVYLNSPAFLWLPRSRFKRAWRAQSDSYHPPPTALVLMRLEEHLAANNRRGKTSGWTHRSDNCQLLQKRCSLVWSWFWSCSVRGLITGRGALRASLLTESWAAQQWAFPVFSEGSLSFLFQVVSGLNDEICIRWDEKHLITADISSQRQPQRSKTLWRYRGQCCLIDVATPDSSLLNKGASEGRLRSALRFYVCSIAASSSCLFLSGRKVTLSAD